MNSAPDENVDRDRESNSCPAHVRGSARGTVSNPRLEQIRERLREGAYDGAAVREATARGIVARGDL